MECINGKKRYYVVNLSSVYDNTVKLTLPGTGYEVQEMDRAYFIDSTIETTLKPGCALFIDHKGEKSEKITPNL